MNTNVAPVRKKEWLMTNVLVREGGEEEEEEEEEEERKGSCYEK